VDEGLLLQGPDRTFTHPLVYDVSLGTSPSFVAFNTISRMAVTFDSDNPTLGTRPVEIAINGASMEIQKVIYKLGLESLHMICLY
jgi:hypothetical protein